MTPQEQQMLQSLTDRVNKAPLTEKDAEAEQYLHETLGRNPDALYILAQTTLVQGYALEQAQKQLADLKQQLTQAQQHVEPKHTSFLGSLLGHSEDPAPPPPPPLPSQSQRPQYQPVQQYAQQQQSYGQPQYAQQPGMMGGGMMGGGSFLGSAMRTAAGVAAGALAFQGIESLMHGFGGGGGFGGGQGLGGFGGGQPREEIVNNYYGDQGSNDSGRQSSDIEDRRDDAGGNNFADASNDVTDDSTLNDTGSDDSSNSFDDSGSNDSDFSSNDSGDSGSSDDSGF